MNGNNVDLFLGYALSIAQKLGIGIEKAIDLAVAEAPELYAEVLWFIRIELLFYMIPSAMAVVTIWVIARKLINDLKEPGNAMELSCGTRSVFISIIASLICIIPSGIFLNSAKELTQLGVAPRIYLAKKAYELYQLRPASEQKK